MKVCKIFLMMMSVLILSGCSGSTAQKTSSSLAEISSLEELSSLEDIIAVEKVDLDPVFDGYAVEYKIRYKSDDCEVVGYIAAPYDYMEKEYPILIYNRGGNQEYGKLDDNTIATMATGNYIALGSQYRGVDGGTGKEEFGGKDVNDVLKLIDISERFSFAREGGVYMAGSSRGGMMTYIAASRDDRIKAATVFSGVSDLAAAYYERNDDFPAILDALVGGSPEEKPEEYEKRSALQWSDQIDAPILIIHGGPKDIRVSTQQAVDMASALEKAGKEHALIIYEEADHSLNGTNYYLDMCDWFDTHPIDPAP